MERCQCGHGRSAHGTSGTCWAVGDGPCGCRAYQSAGFEPARQRRTVVVRAKRPGQPTLQRPRSERLSSPSGRLPKGYQGDVCPKGHAAVRRYEKTGTWCLACNSEYKATSRTARRATGG